MGGVSVTIPLRRAPAAADERKRMQQKIWNRVRFEIERWLDKKSSTEILWSYLSLFESDGFSKDEWSSTAREMWFVFSDAAGLCYREMYACEHWVTLAFLAAFDELQKVANEHGGEIGPPRVGLAAMAITHGELAQVVFEGENVPALHALLGEGREHVFFHFGTKHAMATSNPSPADDHPITVAGPESIPLSKIPASDRERVRSLITRGLCACEACQVLRKKHHLPLAPEPKRGPPKPKAPKKEVAPPPPTTLRWETAAPIVRPDVKALKANPASAVVLDLSASSRYDKVSPSVIKALPSLPVQALGFRNHGLRALPAEVSKLADLEVLSLNGCNMKAPLGDALLGLTKLRALDLSGNTYEGVWKGIRLPHTLEALDASRWKDALPADVAAMKKLRHLHLAGPTSIPREVADLPLESIVAPWVKELDPGVLRAWNLRYLENTSAPAVPKLESLEMFATRSNKGLPEGLQHCAKLRALWVWSDVAALPEWLAERPIEMLVVASTELGKNPAAFRVIERMTTLRVLTLLPHGATALPLDLSALTKLEVLGLSSFEAKRWDDYPKGIGASKTLRRFVYTGNLAGGERERLLAAVPCAVGDPNLLRCIEPVALYRTMLPRSAPERMVSWLSEEYWMEDLWG